MSRADAQLYAAAQSSTYFAWADATLASAVAQPAANGFDSTKYPWLNGYLGLPMYSSNNPTFVQQTSTPVNLSLADAHGGSSSCSALVMLTVREPRDSPTPALSSRATMYTLTRDTPVLALAVM